MRLESPCNHRVARPVPVVPARCTPKRGGVSRNAARKRQFYLTRRGFSVNCIFSMATMPQFVPSEVVHDLDFPQREAAFFYGLFLRGHSADKLRRDIEVPRWSSRSGTARQNATHSFATYLPAWWITAVTSWPSSIFLWARTVTTCAFSRRDLVCCHRAEFPICFWRSPVFNPPDFPCTFVQVKNCQATKPTYQ